MLSPNSDFSTGLRRLPDLGNAQHRLFAIVTNLAAGRYYYSVQAIDSALAASAFSTNGMFEIGIPKILEIKRNSEGQAQLRGSGLASNIYLLQYSCDLVNWTTLTNLVTDPNGLFQFTEDKTSTGAGCYYRLRSN